MSDLSLTRTPLIGKIVEVVDVTGGTYKGLKGKVVEDKMNVLVLEDEGKRKMVPKKVCTFGIYDQGRFLGEITGDLLIGRPEERCSDRRCS